MTDHPDEPSDSVNSKPVTTNAPVKGHHESKEKQEKKEDLLKAFDPKTARAMMMLKAKYPQADNILSALLADVENNEKDSDVADLSHEFKVDKLTKEVDILQKEINLLKRDKTQNAVKESRTSLYDALTEDDGMNEYDAGIGARTTSNKWRNAGDVKTNKNFSKYISSKVSNIQPGDTEKYNAGGVVGTRAKTPGLSTFSKTTQADGTRNKRLIRPGGSGSDTTISPTGSITKKKIQLKGPQSWAYDIPKENASKKTKGVSLYDALTEDDGTNEGIFDKLKVASHKNNYVRAADSLHKMLQRKYKENEGHWRHSLGYYVANIAGGFKNVDSKILYNFYLEHYKSAFITETGGVGRVVPGVNTSIDVGPNEIKKQAAKFGNTVDKDGLPKKTFR
jgi:hypothetical protein